MRNPRDGMESTSLTDSTASREEEERHRRLLCENENLKKQIAEVSYMFLIGCTGIIIKFLNKETVLALLLAGYHSKN